MIEMTVTVAVVVLLIAFVLLGKGLRGRQVDDHPICRRCGFDLCALPDGSVQCSECGAEAKAAGAIQVGHRERQWRLIVAGVALLVPAMMYLGLAGWIWVRGIDINPHKPVWWLEMDTRGWESQRSAAFAELKLRLSSGKLTAEQVQALARYALESQKGFNAWEVHDWDRRWGDFIESAHSARLLPNEMWVRYADQALAFRWWIRPRVRKGDPIPLHLEDSVAEGPAGRLAYYARVTLEAGNKQMRVHPAEAPQGEWHLGSQWEDWQVASDDPALNALQPGNYDVSLVIDVHIYDALALPAKPGSLPAPPAQPILTRRVQLKSAWTLTSEQTPTLRLIWSEELRKEMSQAVRVAGSWKFSDGMLVADVEVDSEQAPMKTGLAHRVFVRAGGQEWELKPSVVLARGYSQYKSQLRGMHRDFVGRSADLVLRPSPELAVQSIDMDEIWGGEIVIKNVPFDTR